jgi:hypothetical protein
MTKIRLSPRGVAPSMELITEELPTSALAAIDVDPGTHVSYVDRNYEIRTLPVVNGRFFPGFMCDPESKDMLAFLIKTLQQNTPRANCIRHLHHADGSFFICAYYDEGLRDEVG